MGANLDVIVLLTRKILELQLDRLRSIHQIAEAAITRYDASVDAWYEEQRMVVDDDEQVENRDYLEELFAEQKTDAKAALPQIMRSSLFATGYGVLEHFLNSICKQAHLHLRGPSLKDLKGEGIHRAKLYLTKVARLAFPATPEWQDLLDYGLLRNALVHAQGELAENERAPSIEQLAKRVATFQVDPDRTRVVLESAFNLTFLDTTWTFSEQLEEAWRGRP